VKRSRDAQFQSINARASSFLKDGQPVVSVDTKKEGSNTAGQKK
jgi:hypothetical protein